MCASMLQKKKSGLRERESAINQLFFITQKCYQCVILILSDLQGSSLLSSNVLLFGSVPELPQVCSGDGDAAGWRRKKKHKGEMGVYWEPRLPGGHPYLAGDGFWISRLLSFANSAKIASRALFGKAFDRQK